MPQSLLLAFLAAQAGIRNYPGLPEVSSQGGSDSTVVTALLVLAAVPVILLLVFHDRLGKLLDWCERTFRPSTKDGLLYSGLRDLLGGLSEKGNGRYPSPSQWLGIFTAVFLVIFLGLGLLGRYHRAPAPPGASDLDVIVYNNTLDSRLLFWPEGRLDFRDPSEPRRRYAFGDPGPADRGEDRFLARLFPDTTDRARAIEWGARIHDRATLWGGKREFEHLPEQEKAHRVMLRLQAGDGATPAPLSEMRALVERTIPDPAERGAVLAWAEQRRRAREMPDADWFRYWVVLEEYRPGEELLAAKRAAIESALGGARRLGASTWESLLAFGSAVAEPGSSLPPGERASLIAALDRLTGFDAHFARMRAAHPLQNEQSWKYSNPAFEVFWLHALYPNDDRTLLALGEGWPAVPDPLPPALAAVMILVGGFIVQRFFRFVSVPLLGRLLGVRDTPAYRSLHASTFNPWWQLLNLAVVLPLAWLLTRATLEPFYVLHIRSETVLMLAALFSTVIAGVLVETLGNVVALGFIRVGLDPRRTLLDNLLTAGLSVALLRYYGNGWLAVNLSLALGLFSTLLNKFALWARLISEDEEPVGEGLARRAA